MIKTDRMFPHTKNAINQVIIANTNNDEGDNSERKKIESEFRKFVRAMQSQRDKPECEILAMDFLSSGSHFHPSLFIFPPYRKSNKIKNNKHLNCGCGGVVFNFKIKKLSLIIVHALI